jgi:hypothetical protein
MDETPHLRIQKQPLRLFWIRVKKRSLFWKMGLWNFPNILLNLFVWSTVFGICHYKAKLRSRLQTKI